MAGTPNKQAAPPRVLITGAGGQLGQSLLDTVPPGVVLLPLTRDQLDLEDCAALPALLAAARPDIIINAGAYTAVDNAETDHARASRINTDAVTVLADYCHRNNCRLIQLSTDFVFSGEHRQPWTVDAEPKPLNVYGSTKLGGERAALTGTGASRVIRSGWIYSEHGSNFVKTMLRLARSRSEISVVCDQTGTPTWARNLAEFVWQVIADWPADRVLHFADGGTASWDEFAIRVFAEARTHGLLQQIPRIKPVSSAEYGAAAARPAYSVLDLSRSIDRYDLQPVPWNQALRAMLARLKQGLNISNPGET